MKDDDFKRLYQSGWLVNPVNEGYVQAWIAYYRVTNEIEGDEYRLYCGRHYGKTLKMKALKAAEEAMEQVLKSAGLQRPGSQDESWRQAKRDALRRYFR